jgi:uncharacterized protein YjbI with pentapeptide repeats
MISALTAVGALVFTGLSLRAVQHQVAIAERGQVTDRFTKAVDQLANANNLEVRLGGIYALRRIARDSAQDKDEVTRLLAAFLRRELPTSLDGPCEGLLSGPVDKVAALQIVSSGGSATDLSGTCLSGANLDLAQLHCAMLERVSLDASATLRDADLTRARLSGAKFYVQDPTNSAFQGADLAGAHLSQARLSGRADLSYVDLSGADLSGAYLPDATLVGADLSRVNLRGAVLAEADLRGVRLEGADLAGAYIHGARFSDDTVRRDVLSRGAIDAQKDSPPDICT